MKKFAEYLLQRRKQLRKTRDEVADEINVSSQTIWKWEKNLTSPNVDEIFRLSKSLQCSVANLFGESLLHSEILTKPELVLEAINKLRISGEISLEEILEASLIENEKKPKSKHR